MPKVDQGVGGTKSGPFVVVAASNAPVSSRQAADYVCVGAADDVDIQAVIDE